MGFRSVLFLLLGKNKAKFTSNAYTTAKYYPLRFELNFFNCSTRLSHSFRIHLPGVD